jgi:site-specific recombinase XerD
MTHSSIKNIGETFMSGGRLRVWQWLLQDGRSALWGLAIISASLGSVSFAQDKNPAAEAKTSLWLNRLEEGRDSGESSGQGKKTLKKSTQNYHLIALRSFLKYLVRIDVLSLAPEKIELAKQEMRQVEFLEAEELDRLLRVVAEQQGILALRDKAILELLFSTGLRVSELTHLKIENINLKRDEFTIRGKGGKLRVVFLSSTAKDALKAYLSKRRDASPFLFVSHDRAHKNTGGLTPRSVQRIVERTAREAGITKHITPHTLRHTFATDLLLSGADIRSVQSLLGHASITTTQIYTHVTNNQMKEVHKKFHGRSRSIDPVRQPHRVKRKRNRT